MGIVETLKHTFTSEGKEVYGCEDCGETFKTEPDLTNVSCPGCGSGSVEVINRV